MVKNNSELDCFSQLSSNDSSSRLASVKGIIKRIKHNSKMSQHVVYLICKRLIRGLGGSNPKFRQGCFTTVVGFFKLLPQDFDSSLIENIIEEELNPSGNNSKQEEGEAYLGQILAYGALIMTDIILQKSQEDQFRVFEKIFKLGKKRSYLHHVSFLFLSMLLNKTSTEFKPDGFINHLNDLDSDTLDKLNYIITLSDLSIKTQTIKKVFDTKKFYDINNAKKVADLLKQNKSLKLLKHEFYNTFVDSVWKQQEFLKIFWNSLCDLKHGKETIPSKPEKFQNAQETLILQICSKVFDKCKDENNGLLAIELLNNNLINMLIRLSKKEKQMVQGLLNNFCASVTPLDDEVKLNFITKILFEDGLLNFDTLTGSKTILSLTNSLSFTGVSQLAVFYKEVLEFKRLVKLSESKNKAFISCLNYFTKLINSPSCYEETSWRLTQLAYLLKMGFFSLSDSNINRELRQQLQEAFLTSLGHRFPSLETFHKVLEGLVSELNSFLKVDEPVVKFTDEMKDALKMSVKLGKKMNKHFEIELENKDVILVLQTVLQYMAIIILKEPSTAINNIQDLQSIFEDLIDEKNKANERVWIEVLIDMFLNLLSKPYYHHRHLIRSTFKAICPHLTLKAFLQIVEVLSPSYEAEETDEEDSVSDTYSNDENSDNESTGDVDEEGDEEMEGDLDEITANEKLRLELRNALGSGSDNESVDLDDLDEEEGKKLDERLSSIFRANYKKKKSNNLSKYENQLAHFRTRVMDLIEICTEISLPLSYWAKILLPLIDLLGSTVGQSKLDCLRKRISCCIKKLNVSKVIQDETQEIELKNILENIFDRIKSSGIYTDVKTELIYVTKFILKVSKPFMKSLKTKHLDKNLIFQCYTKHLVGFFHGENNLPVLLFTSIISIGWDGMLPLFPAIINESFDKNNKVHKRLTGFKLIEMFSKTPQYFDGHLEKYYDLYLPRVKEAFKEGISREFQNIQESKDINMKFCLELWTLVNCIVTRQRTSQHPPMIDEEEIKILVESSLNTLPSMKNKCKQQFKKLCSTLSINFPIEEIGKKSQEKSGMKSVSPLERKRKGETIIKKKKIKKLSINTAHTIE